MPNVAPGSTTAVNFSGAAVTYTVTAGGVMTIKLWGGAGGQSLLSGSSRSANFGGGGGGFTWVTIRANTNDVIKFEVGQGGRGAATTPARGVGGYPDGGAGACSSSAGGSLYYAGGGGSTRVYLNNTLIAVAGAGGGGGGGVTGTGNGSNPYIGTITSKGAPGGGAAGKSSPQIGSGPNLGASGGSQTAGGVNNNVPSDTGFQGGSLQGGNGFSSANASPTTLNATANMAGPGGGGGYFGGGGCSDGSGSTARTPGGAGGSGYVNTAHAQVISGNAFQGYGHLPAGGLDLDFPGGTIGKSPTGTAAPFDGGDGYAMMRFPSQNTLVTSTKVGVGFSGGAVDYICPTGGTVKFKGWGGGGGGTARNASVTAGGLSGGGGFVTFQFDVQANDIVTTEVARGGRSSSTVLGEGGWPDGGRGSFDNSFSGNTGQYGGGGGSTRIYLNGVLVGVAAGGGAASGGTNAGTVKPSAGGGTTGTTGDPISTELAGTPATQSAGGKNPNTNAVSDAGFFGAHLWGGEGSSTFLWDPTIGAGVGTSATQLNKAGPGGGGGYYGGGGDAPGLASTTAASGGGGSSWWEPTLTNLTAASTSAGSSTTAGGSGDVDYALAGSPGSGVLNTVGGPGGDGGAVLLFVGGYPMPGPITLSNLITTAILVGTPSGSVGTISMTAPATAVTTGPPPTGDIGTVSVTTPAGSAGAIDPFPVITIENNLAGQPVTEADVTVVPSENDIVMSLDDPAATVSGGIDVAVPFPADPIGGAVALTAPEATLSAGQSIDGLTIGTITMTAPTGIGENGISVDGPLPTGAIVMTVPSGVASTGFPALLAPLVITMSRPLATGAGLVGTLAFPNSITLTPLDASVELGVEGHAADLPATVIMTAPNAAVTAPATFSTLATPLQIIMQVVVGTPQSGSPVFSLSPFPNSVVLTPLDGVAEPGVAAEADLTGLITMSQPTGAAVGNQNAIVDFGPSINLAPVFGVGEAGLLVDNNVPLVIAMDPPTGTAFHAVFLAVTILPARIVMRAPQAAAFAGTFVLAIADLDPLLITMTEPNAFTSAITQASDAILMDYVDGYVDVPLPGGVSKIKLKRSVTEKAKPASLAAREIALNEADGVLYSRDGAGAVKATPYLGFGKGRLLPAAGADGQVLGVDFTWKSPPTAGGAPAQITPPTATRVLLANNFLGLNADRPLQAVADGKYAVHYRPFFLPRATHITALSVFQETGNFSTDPSVGVGGRVPLRVWLGVCAWNPNLEAPGATVVQGHVDDASGVGNQLRELAVDTVLPVGWYAAMVGAHNTTYLATQGSTLASFRAWRGGLTIGPNFVPQGEPYGLQNIGSDLTTPPPVAAYATVADGDIPDHAYVQATTA